MIVNRDAVGGSHAASDKIPVDAAAMSIKSFPCSSIRFGLSFWLRLFRLMIVYSIIK